MDDKAATTPDASSIHHGRCDVKQMFAKKPGRIVRDLVRIRAPAAAVRPEILIHKQAPLAGGLVDVQGQAVRVDR